MRDEGRAMRDEGGSREFPSPNPSSLIPRPCLPSSLLLRHLPAAPGIATLPRFLRIFAIARLSESRAAVAIQSKSRQRFVPMLKLMRDSFQHLKWILVAIVAIFILFIFVDWGGGGPNSGAAAAVGYAARVNGETISNREFER